MNYLEELRPGKRENAFFLDSEDTSFENEAIQDLNVKDMHYIYNWDETQKKYVGEWIEY